MYLYMYVWSFTDSGGHTVHVWKYYFIKIRNICINSWRTLEAEELFASLFKLQRPAKGAMVQLYPVGLQP